MRMEKKEEYGIPWLWKRVPVGTWLKDAKWWIEVGASGTYVDEFRNSNYPVITFDYPITY